MLRIKDRPIEHRRQTVLDASGRTRLTTHTPAGSDCVLNAKRDQHYLSVESYFPKMFRRHAFKLELRPIQNVGYSVIPTRMCSYEPDSPL